MQPVFRSTALALLCVLASARVTSAQGTKRPNVLFIAVDDLRPELGCYGKAHIKSPNIDKLAASGFVFERAYCMVPTCGASRASLMTGLRPARARFVGFNCRAEKDAPGITTLNTHFKRHGYRTLSLGKVFHHRDDSAEGWSEAAWRPTGSHFAYQLEDNRKTANKSAKKRGPAFESADAPDLNYPDGQTAQKAIDDLRRLQSQAEPFFLAVGFHKPHLPFVAPKKYWDLYDPDSIRLPSNYHRPKNAPTDAIHGSGELRSYAGVPAIGLVSDEMARELIRGYYACVSFVDAQVGKVLDELERLGLAENTIVVLWGDHGWNLAEHTLWCKHSCFETSMHAPLIVRAPGVTKAGQRTRALTEFIDIYPALSELAGLPLPPHLQGQSFVPLLENPHSNGKAAAIGRFRKGDTIRTDRFRFTSYTKADGSPSSRMLYDHQQDPGENVNTAELAEQAGTVSALLQELHDGMGKPGDMNRQAAKQPNIVFIIGDDCTYRDIETYGGQAKTPYINKLAAEGKRFTRSFQAAPMCSPTRHNIYTGLYPVKSGAYPNHTFVKPGIRSVVQYLRPLGYRVALSGKRHISPKEIFDFEYSAKKNNPDFKAIDKLMAECKANGKPFALFACSNEPHSPWNKGDASKYPPASLKLPANFVDTRETRECYSRYLAEITYLDSQVGQLMDLVSKHGLTDNTLFIFTSEQGAGMPFAKWTCYDSGLQNAFIARWPGKIDPNSTSNALIEYVDLLPTFLEVAGGRSVAALDGRSLLPVLTGKTDHHKEFVFGMQTTRGIINGSEHYGIRSVRSEHFKLIVNLSPEVAFSNTILRKPMFASWKEKAKTDPKAGALVHRYRNRPAIEFYDVVADPLEQNNLADDPGYGGEIQALRAELSAWMHDQGDKGQQTELEAKEHQTRNRRR